MRRSRSVSCSQIQIAKYRARAELSAGATTPRRRSGAAAHPSGAGHAGHRQENCRSTCGALESRHNIAREPVFHGETRRRNEHSHSPCRVKSYNGIKSNVGLRMKCFALLHHGKNRLHSLFSGFRLLCRFKTINNRINICFV